MGKESEQYKSLSKVQKAYYDGYGDGWAEALLDAPKNTTHNSEYKQLCPKCKSKCVSETLDINTQPGFLCSNCMYKWA